LKSETGVGKQVTALLMKSRPEFETAYHFSSRKFIVNWNETCDCAL